MRWDRMMACVGARRNGMGRSRDGNGVRLDHGRFRIYIRVFYPSEKEVPLLCGLLCSFAYSGVKCVHATGSRRRERDDAVNEKDGMR